MQSRLAPCLALYRQRVVGCGNTRVTRGVPDDTIHAVQNARHIGSPGADQAIKAATELFGSHFARVTRADGRDAMRVSQPGFHEGELPMEFKTCRRHESGRQTQQMKIRRIEKPLISQVVNGEHRGDAGRRVGCNVGTSHCGVPVMGMQNIGSP